MNILVVEDEEVIREGIKEYLESFKYKVYTAKDGSEALDKFNILDINLILLDINLPKISGIEVLKRVRMKSSVPILILTAFNDDDTKIKAFSSLCDGYIEKPFSLPVLIARIDAIIKRYYETSEDFKYNGACVNFSSFKATLDGMEVILNAKEMKILKYMLENKNIVLSRSRIIDGVWEDYDEIPYDRVVDVYVKNLRKKLKLNCIKTVRNVGYKMSLEEGDKIEKN